MFSSLFSSSRQRGFGVVELIVVVAILGVLMLVAIPVFGAIQSNARNEAVQSDLRNVAMQYTVRLEASPTPFNLVTNTEVRKARLGPRTNYHVRGNYFLVCSNNAGKFAIYATAATGESFKYTSESGTVSSAPEFGNPQSGSIHCPAAGVTGSNWLWVQDQAPWVFH